MLSSDVDKLQSSRYAAWPHFERALEQEHDHLLPVSKRVKLAEEVVYAQVMHQIIFGKRIFVIDVNLASNDSKLWWWMSHKPDAVFGHIQRYMNHHSILRNNLLYGWEALLRLLMAGCVSSVIPCLFSPKLVL
jgi:hypothetical protein